MAKKRIVKRIFSPRPRPTTSEDIDKVQKVLRGMDLRDKGRGLADKLGKSLSNVQGQRSVLSQAKAGSKRERLRQKFGLRGEDTAEKGGSAALKGLTTQQIAKKVLPPVSQVRSLLKTHSVKELGINFNAKELKAMEMRLKEASTPNTVLIKKLTDARKLRREFLLDVEGLGPDLVTGKKPVSDFRLSPGEALKRKWRQKGGKVVSRQGGRQVGTTPPPPPPPPRRKPKIIISGPAGKANLQGMKDDLATWGVSDREISSIKDSDLRKVWKAKRSEMERRKEGGEVMKKKSGGKVIAKKTGEKVIDTRSERQRYGAARGVQKTPLRGSDWSQSEKRAVIRSAEASLKSSAGAKEPWLTKKEVKKLENVLAEMKGRYPHDAKASYLKDKGLGYMDQTKKSGKVVSKRNGGKVVSKRNGGMSRVGLSPAEEVRAGVLSEAARRRPRVPAPVRPAPRAQVPVRSAPILQPPVRPVPPILRAHGSQVGKKKQGYKARKDESVAQRVKKKRTKKQLTASRHESYGKPGSGKGKGKINRISSKQTDGNKVVAAIYG